MKALLPPGGRRRLLWVGAAVLVMATAAGGWYGWLKYTTPAPPNIPLDRMEPDVARAIQTALDEVKGNSRSGAAWGKLGQVLLAFEAESYTDACFTQAQRFDPGNPRWPYYQGYTRREHDPAGAIPFLRRAVELCDKHDRGNDAPRLLLAEMLMQVDAYDEAEEQLNRVLSWAPDNPHAHYDLGSLAVLRGDDESALQHFMICFRNPGTRRRACYALAAIRQRQGDASGTASYGSQAAAPPEDLPWEDPYVDELTKLDVSRRGRIHNARYLAQEKRLDEALAIWSELAEDASDAHAQLSTGTLLLRMGRPDEAERYFRAAIGLKEAQAQANYFVAVVLCDKAVQLAKQPADGPEKAHAKYEEAVEYAKRSLELNPANVMTNFYNGQILAGLGRKKEAIEAYRRAVLLRPEMSDMHLALGQALAEDDQKAEAIVELQRACDLAAAGDSRPCDLLAQVRGDKSK